MTIKRYQVIIVGSVLALFAIGGTLVDQGQPGKQGAWPTSVSSGTITTITNPVTVKTITTGGTPSNTAFETTGSFISTESVVIASNGTSCTTPGGASCTIIFGSGGVTLLSFQNVTITILNGSNVLTDCIVEWSVDNTNWENWDAQTFAGLPANTVRSLALSGNSRRYLRVEGRSAAGTTPFVTVTANGRAF